MVILEERDILKQLKDTLGYVQEFIATQDCGIGTLCWSMTCNRCVFTGSDSVDYDYQIHNDERMRLCKLICNISVQMYSGNVLLAVGLSYVLEEELIHLIEDLESKYKIKFSGDFL